MNISKELRPRFFTFCAFLFLLIFGLRSASAQCKTGDPAGKYAGAATSSQSGELALTLNLTCNKGAYAGTLDTPVGVYTVVSGAFTNGTLMLELFPVTTTSRFR